MFDSCIIFILFWAVECFFSFSPVVLTSLAKFRSQTHCQKTSPNDIKGSKRNFLFRKKQLPRQKLSRPVPDVFIAFLLHIYLGPLIQVIIRQVLDLLLKFFVSVLGTLFSVADGFNIHEFALIVFDVFLYVLCILVPRQALCTKRYLGNTMCVLQLCVESCVNASKRPYNDKLLLLIVYKIGNNLTYPTFTRIRC